MKVPTTSHHLFFSHVLPPVGHHGGKNALTNITLYLNTHKSTFTVMHIHIFTHIIQHTLIKLTDKS